MRCPHCKREGTAYFRYHLNEASKVYGCKACKKAFRTKIERPAPPLRWEEAREILPDVD
jgi:transposase-like protein